MDTQVGDSGYLRVAKNEDRILVAGILFNNGYTVSVVRKKRNGKTYEYYVKYETKEKDIPEQNERS